MNHNFLILTAFLFAISNDKEIYCSADETRILQRRSNLVNPKIVGGTAATSGQFPYQVRLSIASGSTTYLCGGTIVSTSLVVTAAHCVTSSTASTSSPVFLSGISVTAIAGQIDRSTTPSTMQTRTASNVLVHASYSSNTYLNDVALLYFATPFNFTSAVGSLPLPPQGTAFAGGLICTVSGFGDTSYGGSLSSVLLYASVSVVAYSTCYSALLAQGNIVYSSMLCTSTTNNKDTCQGDSGGPVACASGGITYLAGIVSWGYKCATGLPAANTYVSAFTDAINAAISNVGTNGGLYSGTVFKSTSTLSTASNTIAASDSQNSQTSQNSNSAKSAATYNCIAHAGLLLTALLFAWAAVVCARSS